MDSTRDISLTDLQTQNYQMRIARLSQNAKSKLNNFLDAQTDKLAQQFKGRPLEYKDALDELKHNLMDHIYEKIANIPLQFPPEV